MCPFSSAPYEYKFCTMINYGQDLRYLLSLIWNCFLFTLGEHRLMVCKNKIFRWRFELKSGELTRDWRTLLILELRNLLSSPSYYGDQIKPPQTGVHYFTLVKDSMRQWASQWLYQVRGLGIKPLPPHILLTCFVTPRKLRVFSSSRSHQEMTKIYWIFLKSITFRLSVKIIDLLIYELMFL